MIVLDTNVVSEVTRPRPDPGVLAWIRELPGPDVRLTATVVAELCEGVARLPESRRRVAMQDHLDLILEEDFGDRILPFDADAARAYAAVIEIRRRQGRPIQIADAQIAAVCLVHDATLVTRNARDFEGCGFPVIDPWTTEA